MRKKKNKYAAAESVKEISSNVEVANNFLKLKAHKISIGKNEWKMTVIITKGNYPVISFIK